MRSRRRPTRSSTTTLTEDKPQYWLTPPEFYDELDREFGFDCDPVPYPPLPPGCDALSMPWGECSYVNPPFMSRHDRYGHGPTAYARKAIEENRRGKTVVMFLPVKNYINLLLEAGAEIRPAGRIRWLECTTRQPMPSPVALFVLRGQRRSGRLRSTR